MRIVKLGVLFFFIGCISISCGNTSQESFDYGKVENSVYSNAFFDLTMNVPEAWMVQSQEQTQLLHERGKDFVAGDDKRLKKAIDASTVNTAYLLTVFKYEVGSAVDYNPSYILMAENIKYAPGIKSGKDYLIHSKKFMERNNVTYKYISDSIEQEFLNGFEFYKMETRIDYYGLIITQLYYSTIKNGFSLCVILSYTDEAQKAELEGVLNSLTIS